MLRDAVEGPATQTMTFFLLSCFLLVYGWLRWLLRCGLWSVVTESGRSYTAIEHF